MPVVLRSEGDRLVVCAGSPATVEARSGVAG